MQVNNKVIEIKSKKELQDLIDSNRLVFIDFYATWCSPCMAIADDYADLAAKNPEHVFVKCNCDDTNLASIFYGYKIRGLPTFITIKDGEKHSEVIGANLEGLSNMVSQALNSINAQTYAPGSVISIQAEAQFRYFVSGDQITVICFSASWCQPCKAIEPIFADLASKYPHCNFIKCDFDSLNKVASEDFNIKSVPSFVVLRAGQQIERLTSPSAKDLISSIDRICAPMANTLSKA